MADGNGGGSSGFLGVIVGVLLVLVLGIGAYLVLGHKAAPSGPSINVSVPANH
jgi:hypothetical protein